MDVKEQLGEINLQLLNAVTLVVYEMENKDKNDLFILSKLVDDKSLTNLISFFNGCSIKFPTIKEYEDSTIIAMYYFLTEMKGVDFNEATKFIESQAGLKVEEDYRIIGRKLSKLKKELAIKTALLIKEVEEENNG